MENNLNNEIINYTKKFKDLNFIENLYDFQEDIISNLVKHKKICFSKQAGIGKTTLIIYLCLKDLDYYLKNKSSIEEYRMLIFVNTRLLAYCIYYIFEDVLGLEMSKKYLINLCDIDNNIINYNEKLIFISTTGKYLNLFLNKFNNIPKSFGVVYIDEVDHTICIKSDKDKEKSDILELIKYKNFKFLYLLACCSNLELEPFVEQEKESRVLLNELIKKQNIHSIIYDDDNFNYNEYEIIINLINNNSSNYNNKTDDLFLDIINTLYFQYITGYNKVFVFFNTINQCVNYFNKYKELTDKCCIINGSMDYSEIKRNINDFRDNYCNILFCTNIVERGIDIKSANMVIHIDTPQSYSSYKQRNGRALRNYYNYNVEKANVFIIHTDKKRLNEQYKNVINISDSFFNN